MTISPKDILPPPRPEEKLVTERLLNGGKWFSRRGKMAAVSRVLDAMSKKVPVNIDDFATHENLHINEDPEGAALQVVGAYRMSIIPDDVAFTTVIKLVPIDEGTKRTTEDLKRILKAPRDRMSRRDQESLDFLNNTE